MTTMKTIAMMMRRIIEHEKVESLRSSNNENDNTAVNYNHASEPNNIGNKTTTISLVTIVTLVMTMITIIVIKITNK